MLASKLLAITLEAKDKLCVFLRIVLEVILIKYPNNNSYFC